MKPALFLLLLLNSQFLSGMDTSTPSLPPSLNTTQSTIIPDPIDLEKQDHHHHHRRDSHFKIKMAAVTTVATALIGAGVTLAIHYSKCQNP